MAIVEPKLRKPAIIAFHLPQFHEIPENNEWWGKGFTEWTNVRRATPLFKGHRQPRAPQANRYYDLSDHQQLINQASLASKYGVGGFCFYHYWFKGKRLLEKPVETMLHRSTPDFPFMFAWANHAWTRAWNDGRTSDVLMPMEYGSLEDWDEHYQYLVRFLSDDRYIKIDGKPIFLIFHPEAIPCLEPMLKRWMQLAQGDGFAGLHFARMMSVYSNPRWDSSYFLATVEFEPGFAMLHTAPKIYRMIRKCKRAATKISTMLSLPPTKIMLQTFSYRTMIQNITQRSRLITGQSVIWPGVFVDWDNTPRRRENGVITLDWSVHLFETFLMAQMNKANQNNAPFVFINAWNEWAEGAYMEPDIENGTAVLEAVERIVMHFSYLQHIDLVVSSKHSTSE